MSKVSMASKATGNNLSVADSLQCVDIPDTN